MTEARIIPISDGEPRRRARADAPGVPSPRKRPAKKGSLTPLEPSVEQREAELSAYLDEEAKVEEAVGRIIGDANGHEWDRRVAAVLAFLRRRITGDFEVDDFGFDPELTDKVLLALVRPLYEKWFRVETRGIENVPYEGGALVVANHSGTIAVDSVMTQVALRDHHPAHRHLRLLGADLVFQTPVLGELARKAGATVACNADAERLLAADEVDGVRPDGSQGHVTQC